MEAAGGIINTYQFDGIWVLAASLHAATMLFRMVARKVYERTEVGLSLKDVSGEVVATYDHISTGNVDAGVSNPVTPDPGAMDSGMATPKAGAMDAGTAHGLDLTQELDEMPTAESPSTAVAARRRLNGKSPRLR